MLFMSQCHCCHRYSPFSEQIRSGSFLIVAGFLLISLSCMVDCLLCSDAVCWVAGRASSMQESEQWGAGVVISLERGVGLAFDPSV